MVPEHPVWIMQSAIQVKTMLPESELTGLPMLSPETALGSWGPPPMLSTPHTEQKGVFPRVCFNNNVRILEIQPVHPKGNQSWIFIGKTDAEVETPIFWPPDAKNRLIGKDPDAGKDWKQQEKEVIEDEMIGWTSLISSSTYHELNGHEFEKTPGDSEGQRSLAHCSLRGHKELEMT